MAPSLTTQMTNQTKRKGEVLEDLVALLHKGGNTQVETRVKVPSTENPARRREVDVLITSDIMGYPIRTVIECKNHKKTIGTELIDGFVGFLIDIGIRPSQGIFVSPSGFTKEALDRAKSAGIRTLLFEGLTADRLNMEIGKALQSLIYLVATWRTMNHFSYCDPPGPGLNVNLDLDRHGHGQAGLLNVLWEEWITGTLPNSVGEHVFSIVLPPTFSLDGRGTSAGMVILDIAVVAHVALLKGTASKLALRDAETGGVENLQVRAEYKSSEPTVNLIRFDSEEALTDHLRAGDVHIHGRMRVPRIVGTTTYWPPTNEALQRIRMLHGHGQPVTFDNVEGANLLRAWELFQASREQAASPGEAPDERRDE